jgi:SAM-dependent methyltransferase
MYADAFAGDYPKSVEPFSACTWWTLGQVVAHLKIPPEGTLVDLGCGRAGPGLWTARSFDCRYVGVDFSPAALRIGQQRSAEFLPAGRASFVHGTFDCTGLPDSSAAGVVSFDALPLSQRREEAFQELFRILRPGWKAVFTTSELVAGDHVHEASVRDWAPLIEAADLEIAAKLDDPHHDRGWTNLFALIVENQAALRDQLDSWLVDSFLEEASELSRRLADHRPILLVVQRPTGG